MSMRQKLVLLYGGKSGEHEISLISALSVLKHLDATQYDITPIAIDKEGKLFVQDYETVVQCEKALPVNHPKAMPLPSLIKDGQFAIPTDIVFPVMHGPLYEDGCIQGLFELANVAYVGCDVLSSAIGMDKDMTRQVACFGEVKCARYKVLHTYQNADERMMLCEQAISEFGLPVFVKPCQLGSSVAIAKAASKEALIAAVTDAMRYDETVLIESFIKGREIELAVLENDENPDKPLVTIAGEIKVNHPDGFYSYTAKYLESEMTDLVIPAVLKEGLLERLQLAAADIFKRTKCKGLARVDFFVDESHDEIYFNEINTMPGFTSISMYPKLWQASGLAYGELLNRLITLAHKRYERRQLRVTSYL